MRTSIRTLLVAALSWCQLPLSRSVAAATIQRSIRIPTVADGRQSAAAAYILVTVVEAYEQRRWPLRSWRRFDPVDALRYAMEALGPSQAELADTLGSRYCASDRALILGMTQNISAS
jgi:antitoxin component HigA of HigAB toxin-antitoxin module